PCGTPDQQTRGVDFDRHVGQHVVDRLKVEDRLAELLAREGIAQCLVHGGLRGADRHGGGTQAPGTVETMQDRLEPAIPTELRVLGNTAILKIDGRGTEPANPQQLQLLADDQAWRGPVDDESSDSLRSLPTINTGDDDEEVGKLRARNERLLPIENVVTVGLG